MWNSGKNSTDRDSLLSVPYHSDSRIQPGAQLHPSFSRRAAPSDGRNGRAAGGVRRLRVQTAAAAACSSGPRGRSSRHRLRSTSRWSVSLHELAAHIERALQQARHLAWKLDNGAGEMSLHRCSPRCRRGTFRARTCSALTRCRQGAVRRRRGRSASYASACSQGASADLAIDLRATLWWAPRSSSNPSTWTSTSS